MSEWDNPIAKKWVTPKIDIFTAMYECNKVSIGGEYGKNQKIFKDDD